MKSETGDYRPPAGKSFARFSLGRFPAALARRSPCLEPVSGISPCSIQLDRLLAGCGFEPRLNQPIRRTIPANCRNGCRLIQIDSLRHNFQLRFGAKAPDGLEGQLYMGHRPDSDNSRRFIASAIEQLASVTDNRFHGIYIGFYGYTPPVESLGSLPPFLACHCRTSPGCLFFLDHR